MTRPQKLSRLRLQDTTRILRWFILSDIAAFLLSFMLAWFFTSVINSMFLARDVFNPFTQMGSTKILRFSIITFGLILWFENTGLYRTRMPFWMEVQKITIAVFCAMIVDGFLQFTTKEDFSRLLIISGWGFAGLGIILFRTLMRKYLEGKGLWQVRTLLIGQGATANETIQSIQSEKRLGYMVVAQIGNLATTLKKSGGSWHKLCAQHRADYIIIAMEGDELTRAGGGLEHLMQEEIPFSVVPPFGHLSVAGVEPLYFFNHNTILLARNDRLDQPLPRFIKRTFDIVLAGIGLILISPLFLMLVLVVKIDRGAAFYGQRRVGYQGRMFTCYKFGSMRLNADRFLHSYLAQNPKAKKEWEAFQKLKNDPRLTRTGAFLRRYSLDELPQLWNVIQGTMSLVGPRPAMQSQMVLRFDMVSYHKVKPGITGLWQVSGRNQTDFATRTNMDSWYVRNWSLWHDIAILCKTIPVILLRKGAY